MFDIGDMVRLDLGGITWAMDGHSRLGVVTAPYRQAEHNKLVEFVRVTWFGSGTATYISKQLLLYCRDF